MKQEELIKGFTQLGVLMRALGENKEWTDFSVGVTEDEYNDLQTIINRQVSYNGWFVKENVRKSLLALGTQLKEEQLREWTSAYPYQPSDKTVAVIMAGNIPLVGFHDFLCVLISGHRVAAKLSSDDATLLPKLGEALLQFLPGLKDRMTFSKGRIAQMDAVIATGSDNSLKYFEQYFGKYPHIFRKNRTSVAVLTGNETKEELEALGKDIFTYFGLGCRNVSHLMVPNHFDLNRFFEAILPYAEVVNNNKYGNNYDYNKAIFLMNQSELLDNHFVLLRASEDLFSPLAMLHYQRYSNRDQIVDFLAKEHDKIQVVVGHEFLPFGQAQTPTLTDYADGIDVMHWLTTL